MTEAQAREAGIRESRDWRLLLLPTAVFFAKFYLLWCYFIFVACCMCFRIGLGLEAIFAIAFVQLAIVVAFRTQRLRRRYQQESIGRTLTRLLKSPHLAETGKAVAFASPVIVALCGMMLGLLVPDKIAAIAFLQELIPEPTVFLWLVIHSIASWRVLARADESEPRCA